MKLEVREGATVDTALLQALERGIEDVEEGRVDTIDEAMKKVAEIRERRKQMRKGT